LKSIQSLSLGENNITSFDELTPLSKLDGLLQLDLDATPLKEKNPKDYSKRVFEIFKNLKVLDNKDKDGKEFQYSEAESDEEDDEDENGLDVDGKFEGEEEEDEYEEEEDEDEEEEVAEEEEDDDE
jgi:hypothetical protein